jgi:uncharacterized repeat protein (TIGR03803 family)
MTKIGLRLLVLICAGVCSVWTSSCWAGDHSGPKAQTPAYSESVLYNFCKAADCADGSMPSYGNLILGRDGNLYGVTASGGNLVAQCGTYGCGTVFRLSPTGAFTTLYAFCSKVNCSDGIFPSSLIQDSDGNFYGVTEQGGTNTYEACGGGSGCGAGTVFRLTPAGVLTTLYSFCNQADCTDGAGPSAPPLQGSDGNLYGTTLAGGLSGCGGYGCGTVYKITPSGALTTLYQFCNSANCADGVGPFAALVEGADGDFYGTTSGQYAGSGIGANDPGQTAFKVTPNGTLTTLHTFCSQSKCADGSGPTSTLLLASDGNFYGTTNLGGEDSSGCNGYGCGTVYKISPSGTFSTLYSFCDTADCTLGNQPQTGLIQASDGSLYGAALTSANLDPGGTVYKVTSSGSASLVYSFCNVSNNQTNCTDGQSPSTLPIQAADGNLYGMTGSGGFNPVPEGTSTPTCPANLDGCGTVFKISSLPGPTSATTAPVQLSLSASAIELGSSVTLKWAVSNAFSQTMQQCSAFVQGATSGAGVWTGSQNGTLNGGLYLGEATLTPIAGGTYTYALTCGGIQSGFVTLAVGAPPSLSITTTTLQNGAVGQSYSTIFAATGGVAPYTWSISSGSLPAGLSLSGSTGAITGTPSEPGTANFVVQVADSEGTPMTATASLAITIPTPICAVAPDANSTVVNVAAPGQSATALLTVSNFSSDSISFSCNGLPSGAACSFSNLTGSGTSGTVTMTVKTTAPSVGATGQVVKLAGLSLPLILVLTAFFQKKRRYFCVLVLVLTIGFTLNGCGRGGSDTSGGGGASPATPTGTATLTVKAVSGTQSAQTTLTLSVQ